MIVGVFCCFILMSLVSQNFNIEFIVGSVAISLFFGTIISAIISLILRIKQKLAKENVASTFPTSTQKSTFFKYFGYLVFFGGVILIPIGIFSGVIAVAMGGNFLANGVPILGLGFAALLYSKGMREQKKWIIPFLLVLLTVNILGALYTTFIYQTQLVAYQSLFYVIKYGIPAFLLLFLYKTYEQRNNFEGKYFNTYSLITLVLMIPYIFMLFQIYYSLK